MMQMPLLVSSLIQHAARHYGDVEIVSQRVEGDLHRSDYRTLNNRARQMANALEIAGVEKGNRVGTLAWNGYRHLELYYAVGGMGAVLHTMNPRLHPDQLAWIINDAADQYVLFDSTFLPLVEAVASRCPNVKGWIVMTDEDQQPKSEAIGTLMNYESLMSSGATDYVWPELDENDAVGLCYTSGTTGNPKGALYSHRSSVLHAYACAMPDAMGCSSRDSILPVVPMFHVNAWGIPFVAPLTGAKLVFPGPNLDGKSLFELFEKEKVTYSAGVPTVWFGLLAYVQENALTFKTLQRTVIGGSACPPAMIKAFRELDVEVFHAWGMTELSPIGTLSRLQAKHLEMDAETQQRVLEKQGHVVFGIDMKIVDDNNSELLWDGETAGTLMVRGPWVIREYFNGHGGDPLVADENGHGWFPTGDVATIDADGYMQITDRSKDVIKSGGEWISSIDLENLAVAHPDITSAAVIGVSHPKWDERPLLIAVAREGTELTRDDVLNFYTDKVAKWMIPDDVQFIEAIPLGATGKVLKNVLRERFKDYQLPE